MCPVRKTGVLEAMLCCLVYVQRDQTLYCVALYAQRYQHTLQYIQRTWCVVTHPLFELM